MGLPDLIEIEPLGRPMTACITVPGSKSITNRALILAALADGVTVLQGALWSEDTQVMVECLRELGFEVKVQVDKLELGNRTITVTGMGGVVPGIGTESQPVELFVGNAGTAARFLTVFVCLGQGGYRLYGVPRMHERPQAALFAALRELGYGIVSENDRLPAEVSTVGPQPGKCRVSIEESSQFASALMLCAEVGHWQVEVVGEDAEESPYVVMTSKLKEVFPRKGGTFQIEPDASGGSYFWAANSVLGGAASRDELPVRVAHWPQSDWQIDAQYPRWMPLPGSASPERVSRRTDLGDSIMTAIVTAPLLDQPTVFADLGRLRLQECERVKALRTELERCGARVEEEGETLTVYPSALHGAEIETYNDHRMAMCFAILGLKVPGIKLQNPACVKKTFPNFFQKLAAPAPDGLGARILDGKTRKPLDAADLFA
jgi:3-phosphoshikimate 1-carboxyvinyltransferase